jgi:hypothetical protein
MAAPWQQNRASLGITGIAGQNPEARHERDKRGVGYDCLCIVALGPQLLGDGSREHLIQQYWVGYVRYPASSWRSRRHASSAPSSAVLAAVISASISSGWDAQYLVAIRMRRRGVPVLSATRASRSSSARSGSAVRADLTARTTSHTSGPLARLARLPVGPGRNVIPGCSLVLRASSTSLFAADDRDSPARMNAAGAVRPRPRSSNR